MTTFIGIDLAWQTEKNHTGAAAFRGDADCVEFLALSSGIGSTAAILDFLDEHESAETVIAVDAPLIIRNETGMRPCEKLVSSRFGRFHAGAHASSRSLYPNATSVRLCDQIMARGYRHPSPPGRQWEPEGRTVFEVYPHPAHVVLFERSRIIKYKKGLVRRRRSGLSEFRREIQDRVFGENSPFERNAVVDEFLAVDLESLRGRGLKEYEDVLDSILCAYLAFHLWRWGWGQNEMIGDLDSGYIVVPTVRLPP